MKKILPFFSYLFHPLFIPALAVIFFFYLDLNFLVAAEKYLILIQVVIITILIPISFFFLLRSMKKIDTMMAHDLKQRKAPLLMHAILICILIRQSITFEMIPELYYFFLAIMISTLWALIFVLFKVKISLHMMGMAGFLFFVIGLGLHNATNISNVLAFWLVMTGFTASSRLAMHAHNVKELGLGFLAGMAPQIILWYFWL